MEASAACPTFGCSDLLHHVQNIEASLPPLEDAYFGHPPPPTLHVCPISSTAYMLAAQTSRCVSVQLWFVPNESEAVSRGAPLEVMRLVSSEEDQGIEKIKCATVLVLDPSLMQSQQSTWDVAVLLGTTQSRLLSLQIHVDITMEGEATVKLHHDSPFEPLPLNKQDIDDTSVTDSMAPSRHGSLVDALNISRHGRLLDRSRHGTSSRSAEQPRFHPHGGVVTLTCYAMPIRSGGPTTALVWVSYLDGTMVRLHHAAVFHPSKIIEDEKVTRDMTDATVWTRASLPIPCMEGLSVLPFPRYHPSPLAPLQQADNNSDPADERKTKTIFECYEALAFGGNGTGMTGKDHWPAIIFFTSEDQFAGRVAGVDSDHRQAPIRDADLVGNVVGGTKAVVGGVLGAAFGAVKWGLGSTRKTEEEKTGDEEQSSTDKQPESIVQKALHKAPTELFVGFEIHDAPRQIESVRIDPRGALAVAMDNLGRVLLIDLASKQTIRTWKGVRDASCCWIECPGTQEGASFRKLFLAIHARQRGVLEVWRCRYGGKVMTRKVGRDAKLVPCTEGLLASCYLLHAGGTSASKIDPAGFEETDSFDTASIGNMTPVGSELGKTVKTSVQDSGIRLQLLRQLLAKTNVPCKASDVFEAFTQVRALDDLGAALDALAEAEQLEESMGIEGSEFHLSAVSHCKDVLETTVAEAGLTASGSVLVKAFESKIIYHEQLIEAYEALRMFEEKKPTETGDEDRVPPSSPWAIEGMSWVTTYEAVSGASIDTKISSPAERVLTLATFARCCAPSGQVHDDIGRHKIYFSENATIRREILSHVFRPLLSDIFQLKVVHLIFSSLGVSLQERNDIIYLLKCFGEWFMNISAREAARRSFFVPYSSILRWLYDVVGSDLDSEEQSAHGDGDVVVLQALHSFCEDSSDLVRAFLLASLGYEAVSSASGKQEDRTYGLISKTKAVKPWKHLLRKLRMCLLVSLRLHGVQLGSFPITVKNVEADDIFSVYQWLAHDELRMSHRQEEIVSLEKACRMSGHAFDPSTEVGDSPKHLKALHQSCLAAAITEAEREEYMLDMNDDDLLGTLLLFFKSHNNPVFLVAHRALLLATQWHQKPSEITLLDDCLDALRGIHDSGDRFVSIRAAVMLELWQSAIRPVYRALFFGFDDVHELDRETIMPLLEDELFLKQLGHRALALLNFLAATLINSGKSVDWSEMEPTESCGWPAVREDFVLKRLVDRMRPVNKRALDAHRVVVCGTKLSSDLQALSECVPDIYSTFLSMSLFEPPGEGTSDGDKQMDFLEHAVISHAKAMQRSTFLDRLELGDIEVLANLWDVDLRDVRTMFMLVMYELGKDSSVDQQLTMGSERTMELERLINDGVGIACRRLNRVLNSRSPQIRSILGLLDADTCEYVREEAEMSEPLVHEAEEVEVSLSSTHLFVLRLLSLASTAGNKQNLVKIHSLSILSGSLMKAVESKR